ncbi:MAG: metabolite traffic protein EboE [Planctomycetes bacterium]|nr:metabolite traffic protein EboE [Planctomycetota bacterium]
MTDLLPPGAELGYCTNVHAGADLDQTLQNLNRYACGVKQKFSPDDPMPLGLWLSAEAASQVIRDHRIEELKTFLDRNGLIPFTFNGFPYGNFHEPVVKHRVYQPDWSQSDRLIYTLDLVHILVQLIPPGSQAGISTLPIAWPGDPCPTCPLDIAAKNLIELAQQLKKLEDDSGTCIHIDIEPEPGCLLDTSDDVVNFFNDHLFPHAPRELISRYLRICHDVCHSAVMFEDHAAAFQRYGDHQIKVGKIQVSSAIHVPFDKLNSDQIHDALTELKKFQEDRYLHQTNIRGNHSRMSFFEDLPQAIAATGDMPPAHPWRIHFHLPIFLERVGLLESTQGEIQKCLRAARELTDCELFEVETYAWNVLPEELAAEDLAEGIAQELIWFRDHFQPECST